MSIGFLIIYTALVAVVGGIGTLAASEHTDANGAWVAIAATFVALLILFAVGAEQLL